MQTTLVTLAIVTLVAMFPAWFYAGPALVAALPGMGLLPLLAVPLLFVVFACACLYAAEHC